MECWVNESNGIIPVLQYSNSKAATKRSRATSICGFSSQYSKIPPRAGNVI
jgi:hypothetical protein